MIFRTPLRFFGAVALLVAAFFTIMTPAWGKVLRSREEALALAFPGAERVENRLFTLTDEEAQQAATLSSTPIASPQVTMYVGYRGGETLGYAFLDTRNVRTLPGAFLVVISPAGAVQKVMVLAFHEPEEYLPPERWLRQFEQQPLGPALQLHRSIHGIAGATLSSQAVTNAVRYSLALFHILIQERR
jgi:transcriptional regulator of nitric oxide reductase